MRWLLPFLISAQVSAASLEAKFLRALTRAPDAPAIERLNRDYLELKTVRAACRIQLRANQVPAACYLALRLEIDLNMHPGAAGRRALTAKLDALCRRAALESAVPPAGEHALSPACARWLREARAIQSYRSSGP